LFTSAARAAAVDIEVYDFYFDPTSASGAPGDTITFHNTGSATHQVVAADGSFNSGPLDSGDSFAITLGDQAIAFACARHESMTGTIAVEAVSSASTSAPATTAPPVVAAASATTDSTLAFTGSNSTATAAVAGLALAFGAAALLAVQRRRATLGAVIVGDSLLPSRDCERRDRVRRPPAEL
jgi:LPXTG-motif cell wall-anchored protein